MIIHRLTDGQRVTLKKSLNRQMIQAFVIVLICLVSGCRLDHAQRDQVIVFAAASLQPALQEVADRFQEEHGITVRLNFSASGALAEQILSGADADLFISANRLWIDEISDRGLAAKSVTSPLVSNSIVVVAHESTDWKLDSIERLNELPFRYLVIGDPAFVPAGNYAKQYLQSVSESESGSSLWNLLADRASPTADLRRVLALVESDRSLIGMTYATDVSNSSAVRVIYQMPEAEISVNYHVLEMGSDAGNADRAQNVARFLKCLSSESSATIFEKFGFTSHARSP